MKAEFFLAVGLSKLFRNALLTLPLQALVVLIVQMHVARSPSFKLLSVEPWPQDTISALYGDVGRLPYNIVTVTKHGN